MKKLLIFLIILISITSNVAWSSPGFKDLKAGIPIFQVMKFCDSLVLESKSGDVIFDEKNYVKCYGIDNIKFQGLGELTLVQLNLDMGPIVASDGSFFSKLNNRLVSSNDEPNIYLKMKKNFDAKYVLDYEYSERDRQLFNEGEKEELLGVYLNGQVTLKINRNERDLWLYIEYRDVDSAKSFLEKNRPVIANLDDF